MPVKVHFRTRIYSTHQRKLLLFIPHLRKKVNRIHKKQPQMRLFQNNFRGYMTSSHKKSCGSHSSHTPRLSVFCPRAVQKALRYLRQRDSFSLQLVEKLPGFYISGNRTEYWALFRNIVEGQFLPLDRRGCSTKKILQCRRIGLFIHDPSPFWCFLILAELRYMHIL